MRLISVWHPSFLSLLLDELPKPANKLWPRLKVVSCWADGHSGMAAKDLQARLPGVLIQPKGLVATEGIVSFPFAGHWPLAVRSHFFEFIGDGSGVRRADELQPGQTYEVVVTTSGGLYRYRLNDLVRVDGHVANTPSIRLIGKPNHISDRFGEKLSEPFVAETLRRLSQHFGISWAFAMLAPEGNSYTLFIEGDAPEHLASSLDARLRDNPQYAYCRELQQLAAPRVFKVTANAASAFVQRLVARGQRLGDIKPTALSPLETWKDYFKGIHSE